MTGSSIGVVALSAKLERLETVRTRPVSGATAADTTQFGAVV